MQKFFIDANYFNNKTLPSDLINQVSKVLRYKIGDKFIIGLNNKNYLVELTDISNKTLSYNVIEELDINNELDINVTLLQGYPKGDKFEDIVKNTTQLGVTNIIPLIMDRTQFNIPKERRDNKLARFNKIALEASEQSMRNIIPHISEFKKLNEIDYSIYDKVFVCYEEEAKKGEIKGLKDLLANLDKDSKIAFIVGPEGGISTKEIEYLKGLNNVYFIALGKRILRTELASNYFLSIISYERNL